MHTKGAESDEVIKKIRCIWNLPFSIMHLPHSLMHGVEFSSSDFVKVYFKNTFWHRKSHTTLQLMHYSKKILADLGVYLHSKKT